MAAPFSRMSTTTRPSRSGFSRTCWRSASSGSASCSRPIARDFARSARSRARRGSRRRAPRGCGALHADARSLRSPTTNAMRPRTWPPEPDTAALATELAACAAAGGIPAVAVGDAGAMARACQLAAGRQGSAISIAGHRGARLPCRGNERRAPGTQRSDARAAAGARRRRRAGRCVARRAPAAVAALRRRRMVVHRNAARRAAAGGRGADAEVSGRPVRSTSRKARWRRSKRWARRTVRRTCCSSSTTGSRICWSTNSRTRRTRNST